MRQLVELRLRQQVVVQQRGREGWVRRAGRDGEEGREGLAQVLDVCGEGGHGGFWGGEGWLSAGWGVECGLRVYGCG